MLVILFGIIHVYYKCRQRHVKPFSNIPNYIQHYYTQVFQYHNKMCYSVQPEMGMLQGISKLQGICYFYCEYFHKKDALSLR